MNTQRIIHWWLFADGLTTLTARLIRGRYQRPAEHTIFLTPAGMGWLLEQPEHYHMPHLFGGN